MTSIAHSGVGGEHYHGKALLGRGYLESVGRRERCRGNGIWLRKRAEKFVFPRGGLSALQSCVGWVSPEVFRRT